MWQALAKVAAAAGVVACTAGSVAKYNKASNPKYVIHLNSSIFQAYKDFKGQFQYYVFEKKGAGASACLAGHKLVIVRPLDSAARVKRPPVIMHLAHDGEWYCEIAEKLGGWTPPNDECVQTSKYKWTLGQTLSKIMDTMDKFGQYRLLTNNCRTFLQRAIKKMQESGPPELLSPPKTDDEFKLMCIDRQYKLDIQPQWRYYACDRDDQENSYARTRVTARGTDLLASCTRKYK